MLGTPYFKHVDVHLENGKDVTISAPDNSDSNRYIQSLKLNGRSIERNYLTHEQLTKGASIRFQMSDTPNTGRGTADADRPYSFSLAND